MTPPSQLTVIRKKFCYPRLVQTRGTAHRTYHLLDHLGDHLIVVVAIALIWNSITHLRMHHTTLNIPRTISKVSPGPPDSGGSDANESSGPETPWTHTLVPLVQPPQFTFQDINELAGVIATQVVLHAQQAPVPVVVPAPAHFRIRTQDPDPFDGVFPEKLQTFYAQ